MVPERTVANAERIERASERAVDSEEREDDSEERQVDREREVELQGDDQPGVQQLQACPGGEVRGAEQRIAGGDGDGKET